MKTKITAIGDVVFRFSCSGRTPAVTAKRFPSSSSHGLSLPCVVAIVLCFGIASSSRAQAADKQQKLESLLRRFPDADTNKDGKLTVEEAKAYNAAHPDLRRNRQADGKDKTDGEGEAMGSAQVLALYEGREFKGVQYRLLKPIDLEKNPNKKYPMVLSLHGAGGTGTDNVRNLRYWNTVMAQEELRRKHPCFVVAPQTTLPWQTTKSVAYFTQENISKMPKEWLAVGGGRFERMQRNPSAANLDRVFLLLDALAKEFPIDTDRVYVLGHSMGGFGTWTALAEQPDRFAAAITAAGWPGPWLDAKAFKDIPIWSFQGAKDKPEQVILGNSTFEWMKAIGAKVKFTEVANIGHGVMVPAFSYTGDSDENTGVTKYASDRCDKTADVWDWLFAQKRAAK